MGIVSVLLNLTRTRGVLPICGILFKNICILKVWQPVFTSWQQQGTMDPCCQLSVQPNLSKNTVQAESCYPILVLSAELSCCVVESFYPRHMKPYSSVSVLRCTVFAAARLPGTNMTKHCDQQPKNLSDIRFKRWCSADSSLLLLRTSAATSESRTGAP